MALPGRLQHLIHESLGNARLDCPPARRVNREGGNEAGIPLGHEGYRLFIQIESLLNAVYPRFDGVFYPLVPLGVGRRPPSRLVGFLHTRP